MAIHPAYSQTTPNTHPSETINSSGLLSLRTTNALASSLGFSARGSSTASLLDSSTLILSPTSLAFIYEIGSTVPIAQRLAVTASGNALSFTAAASTSDGAGWLSIAPASATTPADISVAVNPAGLAAGSYNGTVTVSSPDAGNSPQTASVSLTITFKNPVPTLSNLNPSSTAAGGSAFTLTITGSNFVADSTVQWNGANRKTTYDNSTQLQAAISAADIATQGSAEVRVVNPSPGGGTSNTLTFTITPQCPYAISPSSRSHGSGAEFGSVSVTAKSGCDWVATSNNAWLLISSGASGSGNGEVRYAVQANPTSNQRFGSLNIAGLLFTVIQAGGIVPSISNVSPPLIKAGSPGFDLTLMGRNFVVGSVVRWNNQDRSTTFLGTTQVRATILSSDISGSGTAQVSVANPGGATSNTWEIKIDPVENPVPSISLLSPAAMMRGQSGFTLSVLGTSFVPASKVRWNGSDRPTSYVSGTMLTALIPGADVAELGTASITVFNPTPAGGSSQAISFVIWSGTGITDISPNLSLLGGSGFKLTVFGMNFVSPSQSAPNTKNEQGSTFLSSADPGTIVLWNGQPLPTVVVSSTQLTAQVPASLLTTAGTANISVTSSTGSGGSSNTVPLPVTLTKPAPLLSKLSLESISAAGGGYQLVAEGKNFLDGSKVLWNGSARDTHFVDSTRLEAAMVTSDVTAGGVSTVSITTPTPGGGESNKKNFVFSGNLYFPRLVSTDGSGTGADDSEYTGIAVANLGSEAADLTFTAFDKGGEPLAGAGVTNPASISIKPGQQLPVVDFQLFGASLPIRKPVGWFKAESTSGKTVGFFLMFNRTLSILDGTDVSAATANLLVLPEIEGSGFTQLHVVNPNIESTNVLFELYGADGKLRTPGVVRTLKPNSAAVEKTADMFSQVAVGPSDYIRLTADRGILALEYFGKTDRYVAALNGQDAERGSTILYSPQYVVGGQDWWTALTVVNLDANPGKVSMRLIGDDGTQIGSTQVRDIPARGKLAITSQSFFVDAGQSARQGYVAIQSDGIRLTGSVVFGDPARNQFSSSLPLESNLKGDVVFSQLASDDTYFTGVAILNPGDTSANVNISVYDKDGNLIATKVESIGAGRRKSALLTEYFPQMLGDKRSSGYIRLRSDRGIAGFALFGTQRLTALSAVPAQAVP